MPLSRSDSFTLVHVCRKQRLLACGVIEVAYFLVFLILCGKPSANSF